MADRFNLSYPDLQVRFGLMSREEVWSYVESAPMSVATIAEPATERRTVHRPRLRDLTPRADAFVVALSLNGAVPATHAIPELGPDLAAAGLRVTNDGTIVVSTQ